MDENNTYDIYEDQIRVCYGKVVYTHKAHEKCADLCDKYLNQLKWCQIILSALTTSTAIMSFFQFFGYPAIGNGITAVFALLLTGVNLYHKKYDFGSASQKHKIAASKLWNIRELYLSLLTDIKSKTLVPNKIQEKREKLQIKLATIYSDSIRISPKGYKEAQDALKIKEDLTFSDNEIDAFLPDKLRKKNKLY